MLARMVLTSQRSSASPAAWPWLSLTSLKWSTSSSMIAPWRAWRLAVLISASARSSKPRLFRQPVSGSAREISISAARWRSWFRASHALITPVHANITANRAW